LKPFGKWLAGLLAAVLTGVLVYWFTVGFQQPLDRGQSTVDAGSPTTPASTPTTPVQTPTTQPPPTTRRPTLAFLDRVKGKWSLQSWTEAGGPTTLGIEVLRGTLVISDRAQADWQMDIQQVNRPTTPQPSIFCGGQVTLSGKIEGVPGGTRNGAKGWTTDLSSIDHATTGEGWIWRALCGWAVIGTRAPYSTTIDGSPSVAATRMEMANEYGTLRWVRA
jgi:hypothetical protein